MHILIAEDDAVARHLLASAVQQWGHTVTAVSGGPDAWEILRSVSPPPLAVLNAVLPGLDGVEVCRRVRARVQGAGQYLMLLGTRHDKADVVAGLSAGADDYLVKPFDLMELQARLGVGTRFVQLQQRLADRVRELEDALANVKQLQGLLPVCAWCQKIRNDENYWERVEDYLASRSDARVTHGICPECLGREAAKIGKKAPGTEA